MALYRRPNGVVWDIDDAPEGTLARRLLDRGDLTPVEQTGKPKRARAAKKAAPVPAEPDTAPETED